MLRRHLLEDIRLAAIAVQKTAVELIIQFREALLVLFDNNDFVTPLHEQLGRVDRQLPRSDEYDSHAISLRRPIHVFG